MASRKDQDSWSQNQNDRLYQSDQPLLEQNQQERAVKEISRILKGITGDAKGYSVAGNTKWGKTKRFPRLYYINKDQTILIILQGDVTKTKVDAIVNAANEHMTGGSGVDGMVHRAAGDKLYDACKAHKEVARGVRLPTGHSRILLSYNMSSTTNYIINTAGPMYSRHNADKCARDLSSCYETALALANLYDLESIAFTAISCGIFGYPADDGATVALQTVDKEANTVPVVVFVLWDDHIYDAWVKAVEILKFTVYDPQNAPKPLTRSVFDDQKENSKQNRDAIDDQQPSSSTFNPKIIDRSTHHTDEKTSETENDEYSVETQPSPALDMQKHVDTKPNDNSEDNDLQPKTTNVKDTNPEVEQSTTTDKSEPSTTNDDSSPVLNPIEDEKVVSDPVETPKERSIVAARGNPDDEK